MGAQEINMMIDGQADKFTSYQIDRWNIATDETSSVITPFHFSGNSNFSNFYQ